MPLYDFRCDCCGVTSEFRKIAERDIATACVCGQPRERVLAAPMVRGEIPTYESPVTGKPITSRAERREDLKKHGYLEWDPGMKKDIDRRRADLQEADLQKVETRVDETVRDLHASGRF